jgi:hypothetical protein
LAHAEQAKQDNDKQKDVGNESHDEGKFDASDVARSACALLGIPYKLDLERELGSSTNHQNIGIHPYYSCPNFDVLEFLIACRRGRDLPWRKKAILVTHKQIAIPTTAFLWFHMATLIPGMST